MGQLIYVLYRPLNLYMFYPLKKAGRLYFIEELRNTGLFPCKDAVPEWIVYNMPDGMWLLAYMLFAEAIWTGNNSWMNGIFVWGMPLIIIACEILQFFGVLSGTWDIWDVISYLCAASIFLTIKHLLI